ncbi:hypothetical protein P9250_00170 [Caballeronia sp. LP006]|uniref:hypothetical protein n=1 Tax=Caballeronia sp. LP006 TaxID=3038552 RepID=UPI00285BADDB|nr:hypothetical protein [Caballeronia sp. LP006]MDR5826269.1 hypothetical protein [Caballeronia sp. LP006]
MPTISLRLSESQKIELEERSSRHEGNVSDYIKHALFGEAQDQRQALIAQLDELTLSVSKMSSHSQSRSASDDIEPSSHMLMEILILLRMALPPDKLRGARAELDRLHIRSWQPTWESNRG